MRKICSLLLAVSLLCVCFSACTQEPAESQSNAAVDQTVETTGPVDSVPTEGETSAVDGPFEAGEDGATVPFGEGGNMQPGDNVTPPEDMPEEPDADYTLPPNGPEQTGSY